MNIINTIKSIEVTTSARLHMGFFDLNGESGRRFGSLGLSLNQPLTKIRLSVLDDSIMPDDPTLPYVEKSKRLILDYLNIKANVDIKVISQIPRHAGLGSGTQMALAIGEGLNNLFQTNLSLNQMAMLTNRGARSGIGIGTFAKGGLVLDGGRAENTTIPPIIAQHPFPENWRVILFFDDTFQGVNGQQEVDAFKTLQKQSLMKTQRNMQHVLMQALPAVVEADLNAFGDAIHALQIYNGDYFCPVQGGRYASQRVAKVLHFLAENGISCAGQSSWGPTGFAILADEDRAQAMLSILESNFASTGLRFVLCSANNAGAKIEILN